MTNLKSKISLVLAAVMLLSIVPTISTPVEANDRRLPVHFSTERRIETRRNLNGPNDGFFSASSPGDQRVISWGHRGPCGREFWKVEYGLYAGGTTQRFALRDDVVGASFTPIDIILPRDTNVFRHSNLSSSRFGQVFGGERARSRASMYTVALADGNGGNALLILYALDSGGGRMGWIPYSALEGAINRNTGQVFRNRVWVSPGEVPPPREERPPSGGSLLWPVRNPSASTGWGAPGSGERAGRRHIGYDFPLRNTDNGWVTAVADGVVRRVNTGPIGGEFILVIEHRLPSGQIVFAFYDHLNARPNLRAGDRVHAGQRVGRITTGHVHFSFVSGAGNSGRHMGWANNNAFNGTALRTGSGRCGFTFFNPSYVIRNGRLPS